MPQLINIKFITFSSFVSVPRYWTPHGDRIYFISKSCSTINECSTLERNTMSFCKRDWYADWGCYECCAGDLCNYYVTVSKNDVIWLIFSWIQEVFWGTGKIEYPPLGEVGGGSQKGWIAYLLPICKWGQLKLLHSKTTDFDWYHSRHYLRRTIHVLCEIPLVFLISELNKLP